MAAELNESFIAGMRAERANAVEHLRRMARGRGDKRAALVLIRAAEELEDGKQDENCIVRAYGGGRVDSDLGVSDPENV